MARTRSAFLIRRVGMPAPVRWLSAAHRLPGRSPREQTTRLSLAEVYQLCSMVTATRTCARPSCQASLAMPSSALQRRSPSQPRQTAASWLKNAARVGSGEGVPAAPRHPDDRSRGRQAPPPQPVQNPRRRHRGCGRAAGRYRRPGLRVGQAGGPPPGRQHSQSPEWLPASLLPLRRDASIARDLCHTGRGRAGPVDDGRGWARRLHP